jgi:hypothetical protein
MRDVRKELIELENELIKVLGNLALLDQRKTALENEVAKRYFALTILEGDKDGNIPAAEQTRN